MKRIQTPRILFLATAASLAACSGSSGSSTSEVRSGGNFVVLRTEPFNNGRLFLNDPIRIDFSNAVDLTSADLNSISFQALSLGGSPLAEQVAGRFVLDASTGDAPDAPRRRLVFIPRFPTNNDYDNGGLRPGRRYLMQLVGGDRRTGNVLRDTGGRGLLAPVSLQFTTVEGSTPAQLFRNTAPGGPAKVAFQILPEAPGGVLLNKFGVAPVEIRLTFNQPLNPSSTNVPVALDTNPLLRNINDRGRIFLEYDDPEFGANTWIPADVDVETNDLDRSVVVLRPVGVLPNNAEIRVIVENTLEDIAGESNVANPNYNRVFGTFRTRADYAAQFDALVEDFVATDSIDLAAAFLEPQAEIGTGFLRAGFAFEGTPTQLEYEPTVQEVVLSTNFTQVVPKNGVPFNVSGGVFNFRNVTIPAGVRVRGQGTNPMVWLCSGSFTVRGELSVRGGNGTRVDTLNSANFPTAGGVGTCGGGAGGAGSPSGSSRSMAGATGFGPRQIPGNGGRGGRISCEASCGRGSGGGGGSLATQGDPNYKQLAGTGTLFQQQRGFGGQGCTGASGATTRTLQGGEPGPVVFTDARNDNNFWGAGVDRNRNIRIVGELVNPVGGGGGGGGGDRSNAGGCNPAEVNWINDNKGGGGGGGGGVLIVKALGPITVEATGKIIADGGFGGGGEQAGSCNQGGGGGSGAGGMVILMSADRINIHARGAAATNRYRYAAPDNDYDFSISADGGVCTTGTFSSPVVTGKYPASGQQPMAGSSYDAAPLGALGGMGIVQLMAPPGDPDPASPNHNADNTNTVLDDNIFFFRNGVPTTGVDKQNLIAWRGFPNASGVLVDDFNNPTNIGANEGDIRPSPVLLPVPFNAKTRLRSQWIDLGAARRRPLIQADGLPRGIAEQGDLLAGPRYEFAGVTDAIGALNHGYVAYTQTGGESVAIDHPIVAGPFGVARLRTGIQHEGLAAHEVDLASPQLPGVPNRFSQYEAELLNSQGTVLASFRILSHTDTKLLLDAADGLLPDGVAQLRVRAKFFKIVVNESEGLGPTYPGFVGARPVPIANVRIGFAFHRDPTAGNSQRFPTDPNQWVYGLGDPAVQETIRQLGATYVMWDVIFDARFRTVPGDNPPAFGPSSPRPELHFLRLPFRF